MMERVVLIPGGARGIGRDVAIRLAHRGWSVALCYRTSADAAEEVRASIAARGGDVLVVKADVALPEACETLVGKVIEWRGRVDALVHAAGPFRRMDIMSETPEGWREMFATNLDSLFYLTRLVAPKMAQKRWGRIVAFSMANADRVVGQSQITAYYLSKVAVTGLVRSLARRLAADGITVNAIAPGFIDSGSMPREELDGLARYIPAGRIGAPSDAGHAVDYLLSEDAAYVTGASIPISGGWGI